MLALAQRFEAGRLSARDAARIIGAGLRGAGHDLADAAVARMQADGGAAGFVDIVARLLTATFGAPPPPVIPDGAMRAEGAQRAPDLIRGPGSREGEPATRPFPGTT
jgi:hypothetical protein